MNPNLGFGILTSILAAAILGIAFRAWRWHVRDLRSLMDDGDGQGGVPPLRGHGDPRRWPGITQPYSLGDLVRPIDPDPALGCRFCGVPFDAWADCTCAIPCGDRGCGALAWTAASNTEGWER